MTVSCIAKYLNILIASEMNSEGMIAFFTDLKLNLENCEAMIAVYILGMPSI